jgi:hypothetical protein
MSNLRSQQIRHPSHEPPANELPVALATPELTWRGDGTGFAVPSLYVYTTGAELLIIFRARTEQPGGIERIGAISDSLPRSLRVNGYPVELLGGQHQNHGFTYRAWVAFTPDEPAPDLVLTLDWPGISPAEIRVAAADLAEAVAGAEALWPTGQ